MKLANYWPMTLAIIIFARNVQCRSSKCKEGQRQRNDDDGLPICCRSVTCRYQGFEQCRVDGENDKCTNCSTNSYGKYIYNTSNFEYPPKDLCAPLKDVCDTTDAGGTLLYFEGSTPQCRCDRRRGYIRFNPQSISCEPSGIICHNVTTWLNDKGECEACGPGQKQDVIYGICYPEFRGITYTYFLTEETTSLSAIPSPTSELSTEGIVGVTSGIVVIIFVVVAVLAFKLLNGREYRLRRRENGNMPNGGVQVHYNQTGGIQLGQTEVENEHNRLVQDNNVADIPFPTAQGNDVHGLQSSFMDDSVALETLMVSVENEVDMEANATSASQNTQAALPRQNQSSGECLSEGQCDGIQQHNYSENELNSDDDEQR